MRLDTKRERALHHEHWRRRQAISISSFAGLKMRLRRAAYACFIMLGASWLGTLTMLAYVSGYLLKSQGESVKISGSTHKPSRVLWIVALLQFIYAILPIGLLFSGWAMPISTGLLLLGTTII
jgi:hypothetical protein